ncbi:MAG TPA: methylmalonyl-CoA epimerase [Clostridia bacterium]|nr:methylmalonyl-CoA epimerase [Clostridia bacterium]
MLNKIDHIGIAVKSIEETGKFYELLTGEKISEPEFIADQKLKAAFVEVGESKLELLESTDPDSTIAKFIDRRGEGIQHIAFYVDNIEEKLQYLKDQGVRLINEKPRKGAGGKKIAFIHPKSSYGTLIELCEKND